MPDKHAITIPRIKFEQMAATILGETPLLSSRFSESALKKIEDTQAHKAKAVRGARNPTEEYEASKYLCADGRPGFPASAIKKALIDAAPFVEMEKTFVRGAIQVPGDLLPLAFAGMDMAVHVARLQGRTAQPVYRARFLGWKLEPVFKFNAGLVSQAEVVNLLNAAGFHVGLGAWRPQKNGSHGMFRVV